MEPIRKPIQKIALISAKPRFPEQIGQIVMCENALPLIGTILRNHGYDVEVYIERIAPIKWDRVLNSDLVGFSAVTCTANRTYEMAQHIRTCRKINLVLGGPHASMLPNDALTHFDYVVRDEGEETIIELLDALNQDGDLSKIGGLSYRNSQPRPVHNPSRRYLEKFETIPDLTLVDGYEKITSLKLFSLRKHHTHFLETSR
ncbi:MAG: cobalamin B12-binding domain-containing protein, partial [Deltaproteobacteria bacterium]|nr:cobalamin B12-binding domain-containing protein [Deltaproteobacteria bacterium]